MLHRSSYRRHSRDVCVGVLFSAHRVFAIGTVRLREATGGFCLLRVLVATAEGMTSWTRVVTRPRTSMRAKRARQRVRSGSSTGECAKSACETPDREQKSEIRIQESEVNESEVGAFER